jgi:uncharacterized membrane protein
MFRLDRDLEKFLAWGLIGILGFLWLAQVPSRIAHHFGAPTEWAMQINIFAPLVLFFLVTGVVLVIRWFVQGRRSSQRRHHLSEQDRLAAVSAKRPVPPAHG